MGAYNSFFFTLIRLTVITVRVNLDDTYEYYIILDSSINMYLILVNRGIHH